jgi:hypothetical protein
MRLSRLFAFSALFSLLWFAHVNCKIHKKEPQVASVEDETDIDEGSDEETEHVTKVTPKDDAEVSSAPSCEPPNRRESKILDGLLQIRVQADEAGGGREAEDREEAGRLAALRRSRLVPARFVA